jgi:hypothetical protein
MLGDAIALLFPDIKKYLAPLAPLSPEDSDDDDSNSNGDLDEDAGPCSDSDTASASTSTVPSKGKGKARAVLTGKRKHNNEDSDHERPPSKRICLLRENGKLPLSYEEQYDSDIEIIDGNLTFF